MSLKLAMPALSLLSAKEKTSRVDTLPNMELKTKSPMETQVIKRVTLWAFIAAFVAILGGAQGRDVKSFNTFEYSAMSCRAHSASVTEFGAIGDGKTLNTRAFAAAIAHLSRYSAVGGGLLYVPAGRWLTGTFNLTSHFTLYLHRQAVLLASQDIRDWPLGEPLPSYGHGREAPGGRYMSFIFGTNLTDVIITGDNGKIDGQGGVWWTKFHQGSLKYTRPHLIEIMHSRSVQISNLTLLNSPFWTVHPVYSSDIVIQGITILAPVKSPNTDGIDPDSCTNTRIEDVHIVSGDDCVAVKSGWDEYGISYGMPTRQLVIRRLTCISPYSAMIALGSEMSGGIEDVRAEDITAINTESGIRIKTALGRGGYVKDIYVKGMKMHTMKWAFWMDGNYGSHPDKHYNPKARPMVSGINYRDIVAENVTMAAQFKGIQGDPFTGICISNATITMAPKSKEEPWTCSNVHGITSGVTPQPCGMLPEETTTCHFPEASLPIDGVTFKKCIYRGNHA
ncbi:probable polygalacturonase [Rhodamnia argentea]|uniref:Probable polygalacturonase n=1 Tax=Rhodamnia argentea TaxID=178133 RepID=A0A8B8QLW5_9MYRT|nr:probable polygalacturonase [Rhodamnia argentea]